MAHSEHLNGLARSLVGDGCKDGTPNLFFVTTGRANVLCVCMDKMHAEEIFDAAASHGHHVLLEDRMTGVLDEWRAG